MAALPSGWDDCGESVSHAGSATLRFRAVGNQMFAFASWGPLGVSFVIDPMGGGISCGDWGSAATVELAYWLPFEAGISSYPARVILTSIAGACPQSFLSTDISWTVTGLRLIAGLDTTGGQRNLQYKLWNDETTTWTITVGGTTYSRVGTFGGAFPTAKTELQLGFSTESNGAMTTVSGAAVPLTDGMTIQTGIWDGLSDPTSPQDIPFNGSSSGSSSIFYSFLSEPPLEYGVDARVENAGGGTPIRDVRVENLAGQGVTVANPGTASARIWYPGGVDRFWVAGTLDGVWASAGIEPVVRDVPLRQIVPKRPSGGPESWGPVTLSVASPVDVLLSANNWSKTGSIALSGSHNSTWVVTGAGAVARALAGTYDSADGYTTTKHTAGDDVFGWGLYSYLELSITANVSATLTVTITYNTNPSTGATTTESYDIAVTATTATYRLDLPFPSGSAGPTYYERAKNISIAGFANGTYTINSCRLVADEDVYVKVAAAAQWSGLTLSCDGSFPAYWWGENPIYSGADTRKEEECAEFGGVQQTLGGSVRMDGYLSSLVAELNRMEGVTATYSSAAIAADLTDGTETFGNLTSASDYLSNWLHPEMTLRVAPNATLTLEASMRFDQCVLVPVASGQILLPFRETIGMVLEGIMLDGGGARAGAGFPMLARRSATGTPNPADPVIGSGSTDASGFVTVPIPVGQVSAADFYTYLEGL